MKIMIIGAKGQLGQDCIQVFRKEYDLATVDIEEIDITDPVSVDVNLSRALPDVIVNCAAYTNVDGAESDRKKAGKVNAEGARIVAQAAQEYKCRFIHISTDYVFDGTKTLPEVYRETDIPRPISCYGITKYEGEQAVRKISPDFIIVRTAWLYGIGGKNFLKTMLRLSLLNPEKEMKVVNDQYGSPTWSYRLALQLKKLIEGGGKGLYHATAENFCTWYELAVFFLQKMNIPHRIVPCPSAEYPTPAARPKNSILENERLKQEGLNCMVNWQEDIERYVSLYHERLMEEVQEI